MIRQNNPPTDTKRPMIPISPDQIPRLFAQAMKLMLSGQVDQAKPIFQSIQAAAPQMAEVPFQLARIAVQKGDLPAAERHLNRAIELKPQEPALWLALADLSRGSPEPQARKTLVKRARKAGLPPKMLSQLEERLQGASGPQDPQALLQRARAARDRSDLKTAAKLVDAGLKAEPKSLPLLALKADVQTREGKPDSALSTYRKMLKIRPKDRFAMTGLAMAQSEMDLPKPTVLKSFDQALAAHPGDANTTLRKAQYLQNKGDFELAERLLRKAIKQSPELGEAYLSLSRAIRFNADDPLIAQMQDILDRQTAPEIELSRIGFAMAKAMEDCKDHARVFTYLSPANARMKAASAPYDDSESRAMFDGLKAAFEGVDYKAKAPGASSAAPIFVTGLPRSGTTLVERILSNHGSFRAIGEAPHLMSAQRQVLARDAGGFNAIRDMDPAEVARFGQIYQKETSGKYGKARVIDKAMMTVQVAGLIRLALPSAKIVLVRRDPRDIGLSMYKNVFPFGSYRYAYDLAQLGRYITMYEDMIAFWNRVAPGTLIEVRYEDLINDPEKQTRALVEKLGLEWNDTLLDLEKSKADVKTLSVYQARQPIYKSSARAWQRYEKELAPLIGALGDLAD